MSKPVPSISVLIPILNEVNHLDDLLSSLMKRVNVGEVEFFLIDGGSTDGTLNKIEEWRKNHPYIHYVSNPRKYANFAFNEAFPLTKGKYVAFIGAHAEYPANFFTIGKQYLDANECDVVGGPLLQKGKSSMGMAIAAVMSSKIGVGGTEFRTATKKQYVDSVAFALYKREIFEKIGLMDEQLIRNQDDEMHYRMNAAGYRLLMVPEMGCVYYVRETLKGLFKQYYQYGLFKPLVLRKVKSGIRIRHLIPTGFVFYILASFVMLPYLGVVTLVPLILYFGLIIITAIITELPLVSKLQMILVFPTLHTSYGLGFIFGFRKLFR